MWILWPYELVLSRYWSIMTTKPTKSSKKSRRWIDSLVVNHPTYENESQIIMTEQTYTINKKGTGHEKSIYKTHNYSSHKKAMQKYVYLTTKYASYKTQVLSVVVVIIILNNIFLIAPDNVTRIQTQTYTGGSAHQNLWLLMLWCRRHTLHHHIIILSYSTITTTNFIIYSEFNSPK